jgi:thiol-disulfide isomerase/thioredoxin
MRRVLAALLVMLGIGALPRRAPVSGSSGAFATPPASAQPAPPTGGRAPGISSSAQSLLLHEPGAGSELIGRPAPRWTFERWARGGPLSLPSLRGRAVLVRWWTDGCGYCARSLPALDRLRAEHARDGLVVIGVYHPKPPRAVTDARVIAAAEHIGFHGPLAVDEHWSTLERWWLDGGRREFTSVTFLVDRAGIVRWVHEGGDLCPGRPDQARTRDWQALQRALARVLAEPPRPQG